VVSTVSFPINNESDGLFNAGTQRIPTDPFDQSHVVNLRVDGVNHREFYNHRNMTQLFNDIFSGRTTYPFEQVHLRAKRASRYVVKVVQFC
jgi:hypothetical protein